MANDYGIREIRCRTAKGLLRNLDVTGDRWQGGPWIFRGQNDSTWKLLPTAMRSSILKQTYERGRRRFEKMWQGDYGEPNADSPYRDDANSRAMYLKVQQMHEKSLIVRFAELSDMVGLLVPSDNYFALGGDSRERILNSLSHLFSDDANTSHNVHSVVYAMAQHHGIPTRLLDWTYDPLAAAYFAAHVYKPLCKTPSRMVIWAINSPRLLSDSLLTVVTHQRTLVGYLRAQDGVFIYDPTSDEKYMSCGKWVPFEQELSKLNRFRGVYKITLPYSKRFDLLDLLRIKRKSTPFLMPSLDNVASEVLKEATFWSDVE